MRRLRLVIAILVGLILGWLAVPLVFGTDLVKKPAKPPESADPVMPSEKPSAPDTPPAPAPEKPAAPAPEKPASPDAPAKPAETKPAPPPDELVITPPPPLPPVEIPPIPPITDKYPFGPPTSPADKPPEVGPRKPAARKLIEEGKRMFNREGRVGLDNDKQTVFAFSSGEGPMRLAPNSWRTYLETITDHGKKEVHWRVSGLITVYGGQNYLLITKCIHVFPEEENR